MNTLEDVRKTLVTHSERLDEITVAPSHLGVSASGEVLAGEATLKATPAANADLARLAHIPTPFFPELDGEERVFLFNRRFSRLFPQARPLAVRVSGDEAIAVLEADERRPTSREVLDTVLETAPARVRTEPRKWEVDDFRLNGCLSLRMTYAELVAEPRVGDIVRGGIDIQHSEHPGGRTTISMALYRLICQNGATVTACARTHEVDLGLAPGGQPDSRERALAEIRYQAQEIWEGIEGKLESLRTAAETPVHNPRRSLVRLGRQLGLRRQLQDALLDAFAHEQGDTEYDLANALSRLATHSEPVLEDRGLQRRLMAASGRLVDQHWRHCSTCGQMVPDEDD